MEFMLDKIDSDVNAVCINNLWLYFSGHVLIGICNDENEIYYRSMKDIGMSDGEVEHVIMRGNVWAKSCTLVDYQELTYRAMSELSKASTSSLAERITNG